MNSQEQMQSAAASGIQTERVAAPGAKSFGEQAYPRVLRLKEVMAVVGLKRSAVYAVIKEGRFPRPIKLGGTRASGWLSTEVHAWIAQQARLPRPS